MIRLAIAVCFPAIALTAAPLSVATNALPVIEVGKPYSFQVQAAGGTPPYRWSAAGLEPYGMSIDPATGIITGISYLALSGNVTIGVTDNTLTAAARTLQLVAARPVNLTTGGLPAGQVGVAYRVILTATGGLRYEFALAAGSLPPGLGLSRDGIIEGIPQLYGLYNFTVRATDISTGNSAFQDYAITVAAIQSLVVSLPADLKFTNGTQKSLAIPISGGQPPYAVAGGLSILPPGLFLRTSLVPPVLEGTPVNPGTYPWSLVVTDANQVSQTFHFRILVTGDLTFPNRVLPDGRTNQSYSAQLKVDGGAPPYTWTLAGGSFPPGITMTTGGLLSGTAPAQAGAYRFTATAVDQAGTAASAPFEINLMGVSIGTTVLAGGLRGTPYSAHLAAFGGLAPYSWTLVGGLLPPGLILSGDTIAGTPATAGTYVFSVRATDANGIWSERSLAIVVTGATPSFTAEQVVNSASFEPGLSPGSLFSIGGRQFAAGSDAAGGVPLPALLGGASVLANGLAVPLLAVTPEQINAQLPFSIAGSTVNLEVISDGVKSAAVRVPLQRAAPGLFQVSAGRILAINPGGDVNSLLAPAHPDDVLVLYATGAGPITCALFEGGVAPADRICPLAEKPSVTIGGLPAEVLFAGAAPNLSTGLVQLNVKVPPVGAGEWPVVLTAGGVASNSPKLFVAP